MSDAEDGDDGSGLRCSFCELPERAVRRLIAGRTGFICDECVRLCLTVVGAPDPEPEPRPRRDPKPAPDLQDRLMGVFADFASRRQWPLAMMTGLLSQLAADDEISVEARVGAMLTGLAQDAMSPRRPLAAEAGSTCDYCSKPPHQIKSLHTGHGGQICGDCLENMASVRVQYDSAFRRRMSALLSALPDEPPP